MDLDRKKAEALKFLESIRAALEESLPPPSAMEPWIRQTVASAKNDPQGTHLRNPEAAFLNGKVVPILFDLVKRLCGLSDSEARQALLNEFFRGTPLFADASPSRGRGHPFNKLLKVDPVAIYQQWQSGKPSAFTQGCPDLALQAPCPHTIVFEGKYFPNGSRAVAERALVENIYQAVFYRGLPPVTAKPQKGGWGYDYACLLAYDASQEGTLKAAWEALDVALREEFWGGANVFVMVLRGRV
jgi:hypothetical protein